MCRSVILKAASLLLVSAVACAVAEEKPAPEHGYMATPKQVTASLAAELATLETRFPEFKGFADRKQPYGDPLVVRFDRGLGEITEMRGVRSSDLKSGGISLYFVLMPNTESMWTEAGPDAIIPLKHLGMDLYSSFVLSDEPTPGLSEMLSGIFMRHRVWLKDIDAKAGGMTLVRGRGKWGPSNMGIACRITTDKNEYAIGEKVSVLLEVSNHTDRTIALGLEPLIEVGDGEFMRQPANLHIMFSQHNDGKLGFFSTVVRPYPRGTERDAMAFSLAPGLVYFEVIAQEPWGPNLGSLPSYAQSGEMSLNVSLFQYLTPDLKKCEITSNKLDLIIRPGKLKAGNTKREN